MRRFFLKTNPAPGDRISITGSDANHIKNVLRMKPGDRIELFTGKGMAYAARIDALGDKDIRVSVSDGRVSGRESSVRILVAQALLKNKKMDGLVRSLTELGITGWLPFISERSVPRPDPRQVSARTERWKRISVESLKQCGRGVAPQIWEPATFEAMLETARQGDYLKLVFWEKAVTPLDLPSVSEKGAPHPNAVFVVLGPEGGLSDGEADRLRAENFKTVSMGPRILKAETATLAACTLVQYIFGDMGTRG